MNNSPSRIHRRSVSPVRRPLSPYPLTTSFSGSAIPNFGSRSSSRDRFSTSFDSPSRTPSARHSSTDLLDNAGLSPTDDSVRTLFDDLPAHLYGRYQNSQDYLNKARSPLLREPLFLGERWLYSQRNSSPNQRLSPRRSSERDSYARSRSRDPSPTSTTLPTTTSRFKSASVDRELTNYDAYPTTSRSGPQKEYRSLTSRILNRYSDHREPSSDSKESLSSSPRHVPSISPDLIKLTTTTKKEDFDNLDNLILKRRAFEKSKKRVADQQPADKGETCNRSLSDAMDEAHNHNHCQVTQDYPSRIIKNETRDNLNNLPLTVIKQEDEEIFEKSRRKKETDFDKNGDEKRIQNTELHLADSENGMEDKKPNLVKEAAQPKKAAEEKNVSTQVKDITRVGHRVSAVWDDSSSKNSVKGRNVLENPKSGQPFNSKRLIILAVVGLVLALLAALLYKKGFLKVKR